MADQVAIAKVVGQEVAVVRVADQEDEASRVVEGGGGSFGSAQPPGG